MKVLEHGCKINGIQVTEVTIKDLPNGQRTMDAVYALGEFKGEKHLLAGTHGRCTAYTQNWSESTMKLLEELLSSMEEDLLPRHFEETAGMEDTHEGIESGTDEEARQI
jgi:hypothetical protein